VLTSSNCQKSWLAAELLAISLQDPRAFSLALSELALSPSASEVRACNTTIAEFHLQYCSVLRFLTVLTWLRRN